VSTRRWSILAAIVWILLAWLALSPPRTHEPVPEAVMPAVYAARPPWACLEDTIANRICGEYRNCRCATSMLASP